MCCGEWCVVENVVYNCGNLEESKTLELLTCILYTKAHTHIRVSCVCVCVCGGGPNPLGS